MFTFTLHVCIHLGCIHLAELTSDFNLPEHPKLRLLQWPLEKSQSLGWAATSSTGRCRARTLLVFWTYYAKSNGKSNARLAFLSASKDSWWATQWWYPTAYFQRPKTTFSLWFASKPSAESVDDVSGDIHLFVYVQAAVTLPIVAGSVKSLIGFHIVHAVVRRIK